MNPEKSLFTYFTETITKNYANFQGRARKREYWGFQLFSFIITFVLTIIGELTGGLGYIILIIYGLAVLLPTIALTVRRLHDANASGWVALLLLLGIIPLLGLIFQIVVGLLTGTQGANKYGEDPLQTSVALPPQE